MSARMLDCRANCTDDSSKTAEDVAEDVAVDANAGEVEDVEDRGTLVEEAPIWPTST